MRTRLMAPSGQCSITIYTTTRYLQSTLQFGSLCCSSTLLFMATKDIISFLQGDWHIQCIFSILTYMFSSVQSLSRVRLFATPWIAAHQASLSVNISGSSLRFAFIESVMPSSHLILGSPLLLLPPIPPSIKVFPMSQLFTWGGQSTGASALASFLPKEGLISFRWTGWISLQSKGLSRVFSNTTVQKHQFFSPQPSS